MGRKPDRLSETPAFPPITLAGRWHKCNMHLTCTCRYPPCQRLRNRVGMFRIRRLLFHRSDHENAGSLWQEAPNTGNIRQPAPSHRVSTDKKPHIKRSQGMDRRRKTDCLPLHPMPKQTDERTRPTKQCLYVHHS